MMMVHATEEAILNHAVHILNAMSEPWLKIEQMKDKNIKIFFADWKSFLFFLQRDLWKKRTFCEQYSNTRRKKNN